MLLCIRSMDTLRFWVGCKKRGNYRNNIWLSQRLVRLDQKAPQEFSFVTWIIWKDRNEVVHGGDTKPVDQVARFVKQYIQDFNYTQLRIAENNPKPPER